MNLILYTNNSPRNKLVKDLTEITTVSAVLKDSTSIINPVFRLSGVTAVDIAKVNYIGVAALNRQYFVTSVESIRNDVWELTCHVDVLSSYADAIKAQSAVIHRQENNWNLYLDDGFFKTYQNPNIVVKRFPSGFTTQSFVLAIAGD